MRVRGLALIIVIGILGVLAVLAVAFVAMAQLERRASEQRVNAARAYLLARSGIEDALARLGLGQDAAYGGENWDGSPDGLLSGYEAGQEVYRRTGEGTPADVEGCPVRDAMRPSFFVQATGNPAVLRVDGRDRGYSGRLAGDYVAKGNTYALKAGAEGSEGQGFYINGGDPAVKSIPTAASDLTGTTVISDYNLNLRRMLGILARAIREEALTSAGGLPSVGALALTESDGWALIDNRPSTGWKDWDQVRDLAWGGLPVVSDLKLAALKPYLTLHAYVDRKVIAPHVVPSILDPNGTWYNPVTDQNEPAKAYHNWGEYKLDPDRKETQPGLRACDFERINGRIVGRAPIDLSWARGRRPALVALLGNLKGLYLDETTATPIKSGDVLGRLHAAEVILSSVPDPTDICHKVADRILTSTSELNTWQQWHDFCDALPDAVVMSIQDYALFLTYSTAASAVTATNPTNNATVSFLEAYVLGQTGLPSRALSLWLKGQAVRDILKANFNPNSSLNKFSPNLSTWKSVDKGDLLVYSTEFSLLPVSSGGHQEVEGQGRVVDRRGRLLASRVLKALLVSPPPVRLTTQKEFVAEDLGALDIAGDEGAFRLPGQAGAPFITPSRGPAKTWGHALPGWGGGVGGQGASLQTYPEPIVDTGSYPAVTLSVNPADYDGSIQLATVETAKDDFYSATGSTDPPSVAPYGKMMMLARYTGNFDLDQSAADPDGAGPRMAPLYINPKQNHPDFHQVTSNRTGEPGKQVTPAPSNNWTGYQSARQVDSGSPNPEELRYSLLRAGDIGKGDFKLNTLYPDGCYAELDRVPEYLDKGNADGYHGVMSLWIKSNHLSPVGGQKGFSRGHPILDWTNFVSAGFGDGYHQFFFWGDSAYSSLPPLVCHFEIGHSKDDEDQEHRFGVGRFLIPHRWELLTLRWDFRVPTNDGALMEMLLNAGREGNNPAERGTKSDYGNNFNSPTLASDITVDDLSQWDGSKWIKGPHRLPLGGRGRPEWESFGVSYLGSSADATFDEFALYDFGGAGPGGVPPASSATRESSEILAATRYPEGRYYKESAYSGLDAYPASENTAGEWFSAPISLGTVHIRGLAWTQIVPKNLPDGTVSFELVNEAGTAYALDLGGSQLLTNPAFSPVNRAVRGAFRLHAVFQPNLSDPENTPILDPLTLDDVTVYYEPAGGARVVVWENAEE